MFYADNCCTYTEDATHYIFTGNCIKTGKTHNVRVPKAELFAYRQGALIQNAMPSVSVEDREFLISGYTKEGWNLAFKDDETEGEYGEHK